MRERRGAYLDWLRASRFDRVMAPRRAAPGSGHEPEFPHPKRVDALNEATIALGLVASKKVSTAADAFLVRLTGKEIQGKVSKVGTGPPAQTFAAVRSAIDDAMKTDRSRVLDLKRKDLRSRR